MASGFPDWQTLVSRGVSGFNIDSFSFAGAINSGITGIVDVPEVPSGEEQFYQGFVIGVQDDAFIHTVKLTRISDSFLWWLQEFVTGNNWEIPGFKFNAGEQARISITNNGNATLTFSGAIFITKRKL